MQLRGINRTVTRIELLRYFPTERVYALSVSGELGETRTTYVPEHYFYYGTPKEIKQEEWGNGDSQFCFTGAGTIGELGDTGGKDKVNNNDRRDQEDQCGEEFKKNFREDVEEPTFVGGVSKTEEEEDELDLTNKTLVKVNEILDYDLMLEDERIYRLWSSRNKTLIALNPLKRRSYGRPKKTKAIRKS